ncbi:MAG: hypothetical protein ABID64_05000 [Nitrospirota bacterium]
MIKDQCISVTDLRTNTKKCLEGLEEEPKYVFINNKPVAVIVDIIAYEKNFKRTELVELDKSEVTPEMKKKVAEALKISKKDLLDI